MSKIRVNNLLRYKLTGVIDDSFCGCFLLFVETAEEFKEPHNNKDFSPRGDESQEKCVTLRRERKKQKIMCMYNISLNDELVMQTRQSFASESAMTQWLQQQVEALLVSFNANQQAVRQKARKVIEAMRLQSEQNGNDTMTLEEINDEIRQARAARKVTV